MVRRIQKIPGSARFSASHRPDVAGIFRLRRSTNTGLLVVEVSLLARMPRALGSAGDTERIACKSSLQRRKAEFNKAGVTGQRFEQPMTVALVCRGENGLVVDKAPFTGAIGAHG